MTTISAKSILASQHSITGKQVHTLLLRYPRWIHAEFLTHRVFSRNAASSRAIPVSKMIQTAIHDPAEPIVWTKNEAGMQGRQILELREMATAKKIWHDARSDAIMRARQMQRTGAHKQHVNRLLEPYIHITVALTSTEWSNFDGVRDHPDAEPHMELLAKAVIEARNGAKVQLLEPGEWHLPFVDGNHYGEPGVTAFERDEHWDACPDPTGEKYAIFLRDMVKLSVSRCASTSFNTVDGFDMTMQRAIALHDKLVGGKPLHVSPCEHQAYADEFEDGKYKHPHLHGNLIGFCQYRKTLSGECC